MKNYKKLGALLLVAAVAILCAACSSKTYTVTFDLNGGELVSGELTQSVRKGDAAAAPETERAYYKFLGWDKSYSNITEDVTIIANWESAEMTSEQVAAFVEPCTVTVNCDNGTGSGFFIDDQGTLVTNYHVISGARSITVDVYDGANYPVQEVVDFNPVYDLAVLKLDLNGNSYLKPNETVAVGAQVYAVGSTLGVLNGSFTGGTISSVNRKIGRIDCYQTDTSIASGNSGGPLVNSYGEVVGVIAYSYTDGQNANFAIKIGQLNTVLNMDKHYSINAFREWYDKETARSYSPWYVRSDNTYGYLYSIVNRYETVTGQKCLHSTDSVGNSPSGELFQRDGFEDCCLAYSYKYKISEYDSYVEYLNSIGFEYDADQSEENDYYYYNELDDITINLYIDPSDQTLMIIPTT